MRILKHLPSFKDIMNSIGMKIDERINVIAIDGAASGKGSLAISSKQVFFKTSW